MVSYRESLRRLAAARAGRVALALMAFVLASFVAMLAGVDLSESGTPAVALVHAALIPAVILSLVLSWAVQFELERVHRIAAGVLVLAACLQAVEQLTFQLGQRSVSDALSHVTGWGLLLAAAAAVLTLVAPAARRA